MKEHPDKIKQVAMKVNGKIFKYPGVFDFMGTVARKSLKVMPRSMVYSRFNAWGKKRDLPEVPYSSFKDWYKKNRKENG